jgi:hypothetical protein
VTWRVAFKIMAANFRRRAENSRSSNPNQEFGPAWAFDVCAEELEYAASLRPYQVKEYFKP